MGQSQTHCLKQGLRRNFSTHSRRLGENSMVDLYLGLGIFSWRVRGVGREIQFGDFTLNLPCARSVILLTISPICLQCSRYAGNGLWDLAWSGLLEATARLLEREEWAHRKKSFTTNGLQTKIPKYVHESVSQTANKQTNTDKTQLLWDQDSTPEEINYMEQSDKDFEVSMFRSSEVDEGMISKKKDKIWYKSK